MKELAGSEKQIAWARSIRHDYFSKRAGELNLPSVHEQIFTYLSKKFSDNIEEINKRKNFIENLNSASIWIQLQELGKYSNYGDEMTEIELQSAFKEIVKAYNQHRR